MLAVDDQGVLAAKPDPGHDRVMRLQQRRRVHPGPELLVRVPFRQQPHQASQTGAQQLVVVAAPGVLGDAAGRRQRFIGGGAARRRVAARAACAGSAGCRRAGGRRWRNLSRPRSVGARAAGVRRRTTATRPPPGGTPPGATAFGDAAPAPDRSDAGAGADGGLTQPRSGVW